MGARGFLLRARARRSGLLFVRVLGGLAIRRRGRAVLREGTETRHLQSGQEKRDEAISVKHRDKFSADSVSENQDESPMKTSSGDIR